MPAADRLHHQDDRPGRAATRTRAPYAAAAVTPAVAPSPVAAKAQAATPSRGPQPATLAGTAEPASTTRARGTSVAEADLDPGRPRGHDDDRGVTRDDDRGGQQDARQSAT